MPATSPWLREQYAAARLAARRPLEWSASKASWRIAMQLRRGDRAGTCPLGLYLNALRYLLKAVPFITSDNAEIILVGELDPSTAEFRALRRLGVEFLAGKPLCQNRARPARNLPNPVVSP
ncbi:unnamed protein product [Effrenium voratum]|uniref:Uncharacterized protein n=1 Tax=Effrenium voratum TaxID=2562239 RepID=A0AA36MPZ5_9DINO|nr:unnamed protein product [Effrenium voratum]